MIVHQAVGIANPPLLVDFPDVELTCVIGAKLATASYGSFLNRDTFAVCELLLNRSV